MLQERRAQKNKQTRSCKTKKKTTSKRKVLSSRLRQEDYEFKTRFPTIVRSCLQGNRRKGNTLRRICLFILLFCLRCNTVHNDSSGSLRWLVTLCQEAERSILALVKPFPPSLSFSSEWTHSPCHVCDFLPSTGLRFSRNLLMGTPRGVSPG